MGEVRSYLLSSKTASRFSSIVLLIYVLSSVSAEGIFASASGMTFGRSSREPKYKIVFHSASSPFHPDNEQESLVMTNNKGQSFICFLPVVEETKPLKPVAQPNSTSLILETDQRIKQKTPDELIEGIKETCIYRHEGWWSYEFCHQKHVRQLHLEDDKPVQEFLMGVFDPMATADFNQNQSDATVYHAHVYTNGTLCDLTNQSRETEIRFVCSELSVVISSIKEISTCKYVVTIQCPMLCKHPMFHQERPMWHAIHCNEDPKDTKGATEEHYKGTQIKMIDDDSDHHAT
ncbi:hypothetical protein IEQ34_018080 [Dendrobium chrysotoxum]|uniref:MRH domain-containing protein n=1 Tax=Dendrobium chrysotoxum TaxID=161865 RepID=A0AAV7GC14_DENCH|nr:hypothetical protein IEQ34_018080 [Dendrobium chrysotoxum]